MDDGGEGLLNTIIPRSTPQYSFARCGFTQNADSDVGFYQSSKSNHPGGANFLLADGHMTFLKSSINIKTYWALGIKANGEVISSDQY
jgi:prepilin-type processing-associated H-X9-DG protein